MRTVLEKLDMTMVCRAFEEKTGYLYLGGNYNTTTLTQRRRYSRFMKDWHLETSDGCRPFHGTSAEQAEVVCKDQISVSFGPLGEGGYNVKLADALYHSPCDDEGVVTVVYGWVQTGEIIDGHPDLRVCELWGKDNGMPIMTTDDDTCSKFCIKAPQLQFLACGTMRFAVEKEPADDVPTSCFHDSTLRRMMMQFPALAARKLAARQARFSQILTLHNPL